MSQLPAWVVIPVLIISHLGAFYAGGAFVRRQLKKHPEKLEKLIADAKALRDKLRERFE